MSPYNFGLIPERDEWLLEAYHHALQLSTRCGASFAMQPSGAVRITTDGFSIDANTSEEMFMLREVLCDMIYHFQMNRQAWVLDIGLNVGIASLYFAGVLGCNVLAFEPVPYTYQRALHNIGLNPGAAQRIQAVNRGIGATARQERMTFSRFARGQASLYSRDSLSEGGEDVHVQLHSVADEVASLRRRIGNAEIVAKIDCEGCEYEIIECLVKTGVVREIRHAMIEWHRLRSEHDPARLAEQLCEAGYVVCLKGDLKGSFGMMYATRM